MGKNTRKQKILLVIFAVCLFMVLLEIGLRIGGAIFLFRQGYANRIRAADRGKYVILCVGESTTALGGKYAYPVQLEEILNQKNLGIQFRVIIRASPGITTGGIVEQLVEKDLNKYKPDMVVTMMGANDSESVTLPYRGGDDIPVLRFLKSFRVYKLIALLTQHIKARSGEEVSWNYIESGRRYKDEGRNDKAYEMFTKAVDTAPKNTWAYLELGWLLERLGRYDEAEDIFKKAIAIEPKNGRLHVELAWCYQKKGMTEKAVEEIKEAIEADPDSAWQYVEVAFWYEEGKKHEDAGPIFAKAAQMYPQFMWPYMGLYVWNKYHGDEEKAQEAFEKAIGKQSAFPFEYIVVGWLLKSQGRQEEATEMFKKAMNSDIKNGPAFFELARYYEEQGQPEKSEDMLKKAEELFKKSMETQRYPNESIFAGLAVCYFRQKHYQLADEYSKAAERVRHTYYNPITRYNYQRLKRILAERNIALVCVQYPVRSVEPLKRMLEPAEDVTFVDNEKLFKDAIKKDGFDTYFSDNFAGDFGHCTPKGNRLLAGHIADVIVEKFFSR